MMLEEVNHALAARHEATDRRERLGERTHDQIDFVRHSEVCGRAVSVRAEYTGR